MSTHHPFQEGRLDDLPISAEVWDATRRFTGSGLTIALYRPSKSWKPKSSRYGVISEVQPHVAPLYPVQPELASRTW